MLIALFIVVNEIKTSQWSPTDEEIKKYELDLYNGINYSLETKKEQNTKIICYSLDEIWKHAK